MNDYNEKLAKINEEIEKLDKEQDKIQENLLGEQQGDERYLGLISLVDGYTKLDLLLERDLFDDEDMKELTEIANKLHILVKRVCDRVENK